LGGDVAVEDGDVVGVDPQQLQGGLTVTGDVLRDRFQPQAGFDWRISITRKPPDS